MNITRYAFSIALLFSVAAISAESTEVTTENTTEATQQIIVNIDEIMSQVAADFNLTEEETAALRALLEEASTEDSEIDIASLIAELRSAAANENNDADASEDTTEVSEEAVQA